MQPVESKQTEHEFQSYARCVMSKRGGRLFRNNTGVLTNRAGTPVRYGLCNDTPQLNKEMKSSDLIGFKPVTVTPEMVGTKIAKFVAWECKRGGWTYKGTDEEQAQMRFLLMVMAFGGDGRFIYPGCEL